MYLIILYAKCLSKNYSLSIFFIYTFKIVHSQSKYKISLCFIYTPYSKSQERYKHYFFLLTLLLGQKFVCTKQLESTTYLHHHGNTVNTSNPICTFGDKCFRLHHLEAIRKTSQKS